MANNYLMNACLAAVLALGLAACSSSNNDGDMTEVPTTTTPEPSGPTQDALDTETMRAEEAEQALSDQEAAAAAAALTKTAGKLKAALGAMPLDYAVGPTVTPAVTALNPAGLVLTTDPDQGGVTWSPLTHRVWRLATRPERWAIGRARTTPTQTREVSPTPPSCTRIRRGQRRTRSCLDT